MDSMNELKHLINRNHLTGIKNQVIQQISENDSGTIFFYDFSKIEAINSSGIDVILEQVIKYLIDNEVDKYLYVKNLSDEFEHVFNIERSLHIGNIVMIGELGGKPHFLGRISQPLLEVLEITYEHKEITARDLADHLGKQLSLMSTHLNSLYKKRLIIKKEDFLIEGGRQFIYKSLF